MIKTEILKKLSKDNLKLKTMCAFLACAIVISGVTIAKLNTAKGDYER